MALAVISEPTGAPSWQQRYEAQVGQSIMAGGTGQVPVFQVPDGEVYVGPSAIIAEKETQLAEMEATAAEAHEAYYEYGGTGYGTTPGGPDVYYSGFIAPFEQGTFFGKDLPGKDDLLLYGALAFGALALLKR